jgi:hypothetical protein
LSNAVEQFKAPRLRWWRPNKNKELVRQTLEATLTKVKPVLENIKKLMPENDEVQKAVEKALLLLIKGSIDFKDYSFLLVDSEIRSSLLKE